VQFQIGPTMQEIALREGMIQNCSLGPPE